MVAPLAKPVPLIVALVPPAAGPDEGLAPVTVGAEPRSTAFGTGTEGSATVTVEAQRESSNFHGSPS